MRFILLVYFFTFILIVFSMSANAQTYLNENQIWENSLEPVQWSQLVAGDINNDDLTDIVLMGCNGSAGGTCTSYATKVYSNNGTALVYNSAWNQNITQVHLGSMTFGDIDNDRDLDLISSGCNNGGGQATECGSDGFQTKVYVNNGTAFIENSTWKGNMMNVWYGSMSIGDINNDGNLDLILSGENESLSKITKIYTNNGTSFIENSMWETNLPGSYECALALGDINNDGNLDLILSGRNESSSKNTKVYINNGTTFTENSTWEQNLLAVDESSLVLGDFNNDGYLDLSLTGCCDKHRIYINNKTTFVEIQRDNEDLVGVFQSSQSFGDYDNDGDLDLITSGREGYTTLYLYNQSANNFTTFTKDPETQIMDLEYTPSIIWLDLDKDMDLDIIEVGWGGGGGGWFQAKVYTNNITVPNHIPSSVIDFNTTFNFSSGKLTFSWGNGSDTETPTLGLYYNLRVGTCSGCHDVVSGVYGGGDDNGYFGNMMQRKRIVLNRPDLENKTMYWAVQTIDTGLAKSTWSTEQVYHITQQCTESWSYGEWSACSGGQQTRAATDLNNCGTFVNRSAIVQSCSSAPSGGSPGYSPPPSAPSQNKSSLFENVTWHFEKIDAEVDTGFILNETVHAINQVWVKIKSEANEVYVDIKKLETRPSIAIKEPEGNVYQYLNITFWNLSAADVEMGKIRFGVYKEWIENNSINKSTVTLERYFNSDWQSLKTTLSSEDDKDIYYLAETPGFSIFAITGEVAGETRRTCVPLELRCLGNEAQECSADGTAWETKKACALGCENGRCKEGAAEFSAANPYMWLIAIIVVIVLAAGIVLGMRSAQPRLGL